MKPPVWLFAALLSVTLAATGQILLKFGVRGASGMAAYALSPYVWAGTGAYALSMLLWLAAISQKQLSIVYPLTAFGYVLVTIASAWLFRDSITLGKIIGIALIVTGIAVLNLDIPHRITALVIK